MIYGTMIRCNGKKVAAQNCKIGDRLRSHANLDRKLVRIKKVYGNFALYELNDGDKNIVVPPTQRIMVYNERTHSISVKRVNELDKFDRFYMFGKQISVKEIAVKQIEYSGYLFSFDAEEDKTFIANDIVLR